MSGKSEENEMGRKIDIGGMELYYELLGENSDEPTLVFDSGYGWELKNWNPISEQVSKFARMFVYDRAGLGESETDGRSHDSQQAVENLRVLLGKANVKPPYVLVGHSFGGLNVRLFASTYPDEVSGVILLDSCHEDQNEKMAPLFKKSEICISVNSMLKGHWKNLNRTLNKPELADHSVTSHSLS
ncbi:alpha/beta fold hydrolase [Alkalihalobacillus sp. AL-G]|uniref:alpha/beta fold hydrolase n=1 Tax=Alkalihalobacillus sp. AL-G TaxID=2926399 RepID=UPI00351B325E